MNTDDKKAPVEYIVDLSSGKQVNYIRADLYDELKRERDIYRELITGWDGISYGSKAGEYIDDINDYFNKMKP